jgi:hypothetical protein
MPLTQNQHHKEARMNIVSWIVTALAFLAAGMMKLTQPKVVNCHTIKAFR